MHLACRYRAQKGDIDFGRQADDRKENLHLAGQILDVLVQAESTSAEGFELFIVEIADQNRHHHTQNQRYQQADGRDEDDGVEGERDYGGNGRCAGGGIEEKEVVCSADIPIDQLATAGENSVL